MDKPVYIAKTFIRHDAWAGLKKFTNARIAVGRTGHAIPLAENLRFRADHARARDAVYAVLDVAKLAEELSLAAPALQVLHVKSLAETKEVYLQRPDLGRQLSNPSRTMLIEAAGQKRHDVALIIADGLSAQAVQLQAAGVLRELVYLLQKTNFSIAPLCIATQARVAISDEVGSLLQSRLSLILIGERPGLGSPHSMGIYLTYNPVAGNTDESRNCISNIHPQHGLSYHEAAVQAFSLIKGAFALRLSGVQLKSHKVLPG